MGNEPPRKAAAIDLGSNSFRLLVAEKIGAVLRPLVNRLETVRLGEGLTPDGNLSSQAMRRAFDTLGSFRQDLDRFGQLPLKACGTEALRKAANSAQFLAAAESIVGCRVATLTGTEEARLTFEAVSSSLELSPPFLIADVGGGSTELILVNERGESPDLSSLPLGALSLTERFMAVEDCDPEMVLALRRQVTEGFSSLAASQGLKPGTRLVGCGGTATALAALCQGLARYDRTRIHGSSLTRDQLHRTFDRLCAMSVSERSSLPGLESGRGRIIVAGLAIIQTLLEICRADNFLVSDAGLLEGILLSALASDGTLAA